MKKIQLFLKDNALSIFSFLAMAGIVALIIIQGPVKKELGVFDNGSPQATPENSASSQTKTPNVSGWQFMGSADAKVVFVEYGDFNCGYCRKFAQETFPKIKEKYIDTGRVKFVWKDYVIFGDNSLALAQAIHCAGDQGKYFEMHDKIFANTIQGLPTDTLTLTLAQSLNLNISEFNNCLTTGKYVSKVEQSTQEAINFGFGGTPTSVINGRVINGARPLADFEAAIEAALNE